MNAPSVSLIPAELRRALLEELKGVEPASAAVVTGIAAAVQQMRDHDHERDDIHCDDQLGVLGQRAPFLLLRLLEVEEELHLLRARRGHDGDDDAGGSPAMPQSPGAGARPGRDGPGAP
ncbi:hypothetical protein [Kitasatospora sp. GP82]|uniref:hypothetical protein n=1 Tax=Kitasatospora sp. GP82 TaxID=3035089 RepID=UPI0024765AF7|nr:hypothetical protein [Kitasatospora sp. GP82]MDH6129388.1 hypothetical protein [Kitasatospora sp. GP82]